MMGKNLWGNRGYNGIKPNCKGHQNLDPSGAPARQTGRRCLPTRGRRSRHGPRRCRWRCNLKGRPPGYEVEDLNQEFMAGSSHFWCDEMSSSDGENSPFDMSLWGNCSIRYAKICDTSCCTYMTKKYWIYRFATVCVYMYIMRVYIYIYTYVVYHICILYTYITYVHYISYIICIIFYMYYIIYVLYNVCVILCIKYTIKHI